MTPDDAMAIACRFASTSHLAVEMSPLGGPVLRLSAGGANAVVALQGAQVLGWTPTGQAPAIWLSPTERLGTDKPVRGGTPVCWPWFANHPTDPAKPAHGFVRTRLWEVADGGHDKDLVRVRLLTTATAADRAQWPHSARASVEVTLASNSLSIALETENMGSESFALTQALHTYFAIEDISKVRVEGFDGLTYVDKLDANARKAWHGPIHFDCEVDRIYLGHRGSAAIVDDAAGRRIVITKSGSASSVVWNPWREKCARLGDMGPDGFRTMVCVETANAGDDIVTVQPGRRHRLEARYEIVTV